MMVKINPLDIFVEYAHNGKHYGIEHMLKDKKFMNTKFVTETMNLQIGHQAL